MAMRQISHEGTGRAVVMLEDGRQSEALALQEQFLSHARRYLRGRDDETDWILDQWEFTLSALREDHLRLIGGVDWITKKWLLDTFRRSEGLTWKDPWLESLDLQYHDINPSKGFLSSLTPTDPIANFNRSIRSVEASSIPPSNTRAAGRGSCVRLIQKLGGSYVVNWDSVALKDRLHLKMPDPLETYVGETKLRLVEAVQTPSNESGNDT